MTAEATIAPEFLPTSDSEIEALVRTHMSIVGGLVREFLSRVPSHVRGDELASAGALALVMSARNFDPSRGVPFGRFAAIRIRGAMADELRAMDWGSRAIRVKAREVESVRTRLTVALGRTPRHDELAAASGISERAIDAGDLDVRRASLLSLEALLDGAFDPLPSRGEGPEALLLKREQLGYLRDAIEELPDRPRTVVLRYYIEQRQMSEIALELGVSESRVSQLRSEALVILRDGMRSQDGSRHRGDPSASVRRAQARDDYCQAVSERSSLAVRLQGTTLLGEPCRRPRESTEAITNSRA
jgi:RNA polymerase sigma factor for flagellar operon FliA